MRGQDRFPTTCAIFAVPSMQSVPREEVRARRTEMSRVAKKNRELHSLRCDMEYKLAIARWVWGGGAGLGC